MGAGALVDHQLAADLDVEAALAALLVEHQLQPVLHARLEAVERHRHRVGRGAPADRAHDAREGQAVRVVVAPDDLVAPFEDLVLSGHSDARSCVVTRKRSVADGDAARAAHVHGVDEGAGEVQALAGARARECAGSHGGAEVGLRVVDGLRLGADEVLLGLPNALVRADEGNAVAGLRAAVAAVRRRLEHEARPAGGDARGLLGPARALGLLDAVAVHGARAALDAAGCSGLVEQRLDGEVLVLVEVGAAARAHGAEHQGAGAGASRRQPARVGLARSAVGSVGAARRIERARLAKEVVLRRARLLRGALAEEQQQEQRGEQ